MSKFENEEHEDIGGDNDDDDDSGDFAGMVGDQVFYGIRVAAGSDVSASVDNDLHISQVRPTLHNCLTH
jgi:hypothetical protein